VEKQEGGVDDEPFEEKGGESKLGGKGEGIETVTKLASHLKSKTGTCSQSKFL